MSERDDSWAKMTEYSDPDGRRVTEFEVMEGPKKGSKLFKGKVMLKVKVSPDPRVTPQNMPFEFDFPDGKNFSWVRSHFDAEAEKSVKEWEKAQNEARKQASQESSRQVVPARGMPTMLGPDGKPVTSRKG